jgi:hypothetical protein
MNRRRFPASAAGVAASVFASPAVARSAHLQIVGWGSTHSHPLEYTVAKMTPLSAAGNYLVKPGPMIREVVRKIAAIRRRNWRTWASWPCCARRRNAPGDG